MSYETIIGLEVHAELSTQTKIFCNCANRFGGDVNTRCCPVCMGMPGALPVLNRKVVEYAIMAGLALHCTIEKFSTMDRKHYYYPDLPKAYQISQRNLPLCRDGYIEIQSNGETKRIRIAEIHIEEDAGKLIHELDKPVSLIDYNRSGIPLIEIVTYPDIRSSEEAETFLNALKSILEYIEISDCKMQEGSLRSDVNISIRPIGQKNYGPRTEIKNINSLRATVRAIEYESKRHIKRVEKGEELTQETLRWDDTEGRCISMRNKEDTSDYRYFTEPDLMPIIISIEEIEELYRTLPELPEQKRRRFVEKYNLSADEAEILTDSKTLAAYYEDCANEYKNYKKISNWIRGELFRLLKEHNMGYENNPVSSPKLAELLCLIDGDKITTTIAKKVFEEMFVSKKGAPEIIEEKEISQILDERRLLELADEVLTKNQQSVSDYLNGKDKAMDYLIGQVMKLTKGMAHPLLVYKIMENKLRKR